MLPGKLIQDAMIKRNKDKIEVRTKDGHVKVSGSVEAHILYEMLEVMKQQRKDSQRKDF